MWKTIAALCKRLDQRLLPDDPHIGWSPYIWLLYLGFLSPNLFSEPVFSWTWAVTMAGLPVFLWLYFRSFWRRGKALTINLIAIALLGAITLPFNSGASTYFIYASAPAAFISTPITALIMIGIFGVSLAIESILLGASLLHWLIPCFILMLVGISNIFYCEVGRKNARLRLSQEEVSKLAAVAERERIARDLHDLLGQSLSLITIKAELASRLFEVNPTRAQQEIKELEKVSRTALQEVRRAVTGYRHAGWEIELENAQITLKAAGLKVDIDAEPVSMSAALETVVSMVLREAVTNVVRHAHAQHCAIQLYREFDEVHLVIKDDGRGGRIIPGNGLSGMRERIEQLNGRLDIRCEQGAVLSITLPLEHKVTPIQPWNHAA